MIFKLYDCDIGVTARGVNYDFKHVDSVEVEDNERTVLVRGNNASDETGIDFKEGIKEPKIITVPVIDIPVELHNLLVDIYNKRERLDFYCIARSDGSSRVAKNSVLSQKPTQLSINDSPDSMNISLVFQTFKLDDKYKS